MKRRAYKIPDGSGYNKDEQETAAGVRFYNGSTAYFQLRKTVARWKEEDARAPAQPSTAPASGDKVLGTT